MDSDRTSQTDAVGRAAGEWDEARSARSAASGRSNKQEILRELNSQLHLRAERLRSQGTAEDNIDDLWKEHRRTADAQLEALGQTYSVFDFKKRASSRNSTITKIDSNTSLTEYRPSKTSKEKFGNASFNESRISKIPVAFKNNANNISLTEPKPTKAHKQASSNSRQRRRDVVREYRPGYQWNLGGRVKELRIRYTARKFLYLWMMKTFGRVRPSLAKATYEKKLKKKCFAEWIELWWETRQEWRLTTRAGVHHRLYSCNKAFRAWCLYVRSRRQKKLKLEIAEQHAVVQYKRSSFACWLHYWQLRHEKREIYKKCNQFCEGHLLRYCWNIWTLMLGEENELRHLRTTASEFCNKSVITLAWSNWKTEFAKRCNLKRHLKKAELLHERHLQKKVMSVFRDYVSGRRAKQEENQKAEKFCRRKLLELHFLEWSRRWQKSKMLEEQRYHIEDLAFRFCCRRVLLCWQFFVILQRERKSKMEVAEVHHNRQLLKAVICRWKLFRVNRHLKLMKQQMADRFLKMHRLKRVWSTWYDRLEEREDFLMQPSYVKAYRHFRMVTLRKTMLKWERALRIELDEKKQLYKAIDHYDTSLMVKAFTSLKENSKMMKYKEELNSVALQFWRENQLWLHFHTWRCKFEESQDKRMMERMSVIHYDDVILRHCMNFWRMKTEAKLEEAQHLDVAVEHDRCRLLKLAFYEWKDSVNIAKQIYYNESLAAQYRYTTLVKRAWKGIKQYCQWKKSKAVNMSLAERHFNQVILKKTFACMKKYHVDMKKVNAIVAARVQEQEKIILRLAFCEWRVNAKLENCTKEKQKAAKTHFNQRMLRLILSRWHEYAIMRCYKRLETASEVQSAQQMLSKGILHRFLLIWHSKCDAAILLRLRYERAVCHNNRCILQNVWNSWITYIKMNQRKRLLAMQCTWLHNTHLIAKHFLCWKKQYALKMEENRKSAISLWFWAQNLQLKAFLAWHLYLQERKRKTARITSAMETYRRKLLKKGTTQWLAVSADLSEMRMKFAAEQGAKNYYKINQVVLKCASHWRHLTARRKASRMVTSENANFSSLMPSRYQPLFPKSSSAAPVWTLQPFHSPSTTNNFISRTPCIDRPVRPQPRQPSFLLDSVAEQLPSTHERTSPALENAVDVNKVSAKQDSPTDKDTLQFSIPVTTTSNFISNSEFNLLNSVSNRNSTRGISHGVPQHLSNDLDGESQPRPPFSSTLLTNATQPSQKQTLATLLSEDLEFLPTTDSDSSFKVNNDLEQFSSLHSAKHNSVIHSGEKKNRTKAGSESLSHLHVDSLSSDVVLLPPAAFLQHGSASKESKTMNNGMKQRLDSFVGEKCINEKESGVKMLMEADVNDRSAPAFGLEQKQEIADELETIKKKLRKFQENKERLKKAKEGKTDLESHLNDLQRLDKNFKHGSRHDLGIIEVEKEIQELEKEIMKLSSLVSQNKMEAIVLAKRAKEILSSPGIF